MQRRRHVDTARVVVLKLARRLEAAGFPAQQAGDMSEAIAEAISALATKADLAATKADLQSAMRDLEHRMTIKFGGMLVVAVTLLLTAFAIGFGFLAKLIH
jgi:hypothetical protein